MAFNPFTPGPNAWTRPGIPGNPAASPTGGSQQPPTPTPTQAGTAPTAAGGPPPQGVGPPSAEMSNNFMPPTFYSPFYNAAGVTGNLGTLAGQIAPAAAQYWQSLFAPGPNQMEQSFMQSGLNNALQAQAQQQLRMEGAYENMPAHSMLAQQTEDITRDTTNNLLQQASALGLQRQQLAASNMQQPFDITAQMAMQGPALAERMFNAYNQAYNAHFGVPLSFFSGYPIVAPTVVSQGGGGGGIFGK